MSSSLPEIDFARIVSRGGSQAAAFEELCCHLAQTAFPDNGDYRRLRGAGGDGGVECRLTLADGRVLGIQAKYVCDIGRALTQAAKSFRTALRQHPDLTNYLVCLPTDPTGKTARRGRSEQEKIASWIEQRGAEADGNGRTIDIEFWTASALKARLLELPRYTGTIRYYFDETILSEDWWSDHRSQALALAGPRYTPKSSVETTPTAWFRAFGSTSAWKTELQERVATYSEATSKDLKALRTVASREPRSSDGEADGWAPAWPKEALPSLSASVAHADRFLSCCNDTATAPEEADKHTYAGCVDVGSKLLDDLRALADTLSADLDRRHFPGASTSPAFRQLGAELFCSLPAANLDTVHRLLRRTEALCDWLQSHRCSLAFEPIFFLTGPAGVGKTHTLCDTVDSRADADLRTVILFGHQFDPASGLGSQLAAKLGLPPDLTISVLLDLLDAEGRTRSATVLLCIDAVDEAPNRHRWPEEIHGLVALIEERTHLRLCVACRTSFAETCLPADPSIPRADHPGFGDMDRNTVHNYLDHYRLRPPTTPLLPPEFSNPLYLRLICEAARAQRLDTVPLGWYGIGTGIAEYLKHKEREFSQVFNMEPAARTLTHCLHALAGAGDDDRAEIPRNDAVAALAPVLAGTGHAAPVPVLNWLVHASVLIEEPAPSSRPLSPVTNLRFGFARFGDFLMARRLVAETDTESLGSRLHDLWSTGEEASRNRNVIGALSVVLPETHAGHEVPDLVTDPAAHHTVLGAWCDSLSSRDPSRYTEATARLAREALRSEPYAYRTMDALLANCWRPSCLDIRRISRLLRSLPMARRDARWCLHLHESYEKHGSARRLMDTILSPMPPHLQPEETERWAEALIWFTAAADGRVRDHATRAAIHLLRAHPDCIEPLLWSFLNCDDDMVCERLLLSIYGALLALRDPERTVSAADALLNRFVADPGTFDNAAIRDLLRCIVDLANHLRRDYPAIPTDVLDRKCSASWSPEVPTDAECKNYRIRKFFQPVESMSAFVKYTLGRLSRWEKRLSRPEMARWMIRYISETLGYEDSDCHRYDAEMVRKYGPGRSKPVWAERIGKKYQWIALQRLASRLHDHVVPERPWWQTSSAPSPLILPNLRLLDPTIRTAASSSRGEAGSGIVTPHLEAVAEKTDTEWLDRKDDLPTAQDLIALTDASGADWWPLLVYWSGDKAGDTARQRWIHVFAYIVEGDDFAKALRFLNGRNFYGKWMPEGRDLAGFVAEYPWGSVFSDARGVRSRYAEHRGAGGDSEKSPVPFEPAWNRVFPNHEYDATTSESASVTVPSPTLFEGGDLVWDSGSGYATADRRTVFLEPVGANEGAVQLVAEPADLRRRLADTGKRLLWTLLGEKMIANPMFQAGRTFSQVAYLHEDGALRVGKRLPLDYERKTAGPEFRNRFVKVKR